MEQEVKEARARLAARFGDHTQIGGKGSHHILSLKRLDYRNPEKKEEAC